ncbi:MAG: translation initiation factor IF-3 [Dehalococcoides mccartyi]|uniref:Translation initiation factor IF-3 n=1 Tax=Dehalococcoides mccartyi TaxID=61435 RepID=A0AB38ZBW7_9CHLR|nr:translation initiation factor IF-3 [Dehalococcoides mccartyi]MEA4879307.1 translation initiation factor IF-3 [Dehalococcoides mccartyi]WRO08076.1 translation initiation factor IF-3 [Dehalococcoides mccartyi]
MNNQITARECRLVGDKGEQLGILPILQAREQARKINLDLVEVAPTAVPPVCRLMDYGKYRFEQTKKDREAKKTQKVSLLKEIRVRPKIGEHDFDAKARSARKQLECGDKVKLTVMFRGREITHAELGLKLLKKMADSLTDIATIEGQPSLLGSRMHLTLLPKAPAKATKVKEGQETANA